MLKLDSVNFIFFSKRHYFWRNWDDRESKWSYADTWFLAPDNVSTGGAGIALRIPQLRMGFQASIHWT